MDLFHNHTSIGLLDQRSHFSGMGVGLVIGFYPLRSATRTEAWCRAADSLSLSSASPYLLQKLM
jgi:hypothetical protein